MGRKRRLLFFVAEDWYFELHFKQFAIAAVNAGWEVCLVCNTGQKGDEVQTKILSCGIKIVPIRLSRSGITPWMDIRAFLTVLSIVKSFKPQVIHAVALKPILLSQFVSFLTRTPFLAMITGLGYVFTGTSAKALLVKPVVSTVMRFVARNPFARFLVLNEEDAQWVQDNFNTHSKKVKTIPGTGIDLCRFFPAKQKPDLPFTVAYVGRMLNDKGIIELIEAVRILRDRGVILKLILAGAPDPGNPASISMENIKDWQQNRLCSYLGHIGNVEELYRQIHILALPSYREGLGMTILEAAATGVPSIATDVPGCRSAVKNGETGILVPVKNANLLADAIEELLCSPDKREAMGLEARKLVEEKFDSKIVVGLMLEQYNEMLS